MTLAELKAELGMLVHDTSLVSGYFTTWINSAILKIASEFNLPALRLLEPYNLPVNITNWLFDLPSTYHKNLFHATDSVYNCISVAHGPRAMQYIDWCDSDHDQTADEVQMVAVSGRRIGTFPMAANSPKLWFYEKPEVLVDDSDSVVCIPEEYQRDLIISKVMLNNLRALQDLIVNAPDKSVLFWQAEWRKALYGEPRGELGFRMWLTLESSRQPIVHLGYDRITTGINYPY